MKSRHIQKLLGVTRSQIQHWVTAGVVANHEMSIGTGHERVFTEQDVCEMMLVKAFAEAGYTIPYIKILMGQIARHDLVDERRLAVVMDKKLLVFCSMDEVQNVCDGIWGAVMILNWRIA